MSSSALPENTGTLVLCDALGRTQKLYLGAGARAKNLIQKYELPPVPPPGGFDARFSTNHLLEAVDEGANGEFLINLSSAQYPVVLSWTPLPGTSASIFFNNQEMPLDRKNTVQIENASTVIALRVHTGVSRPLEYLLEQNYPNPFNPTTQIRFTLAAPAFVTLKIYDVLGEEITTVMNEHKPDGAYSVEWNGSGVPSGVYYYRLSAGNFTSVKKMLLMK